MKKFMKGCAITALILVILGFVMVAVSGTIVGRKAVHDIVDTVTDGKIKINLGNGEGFGISFNDKPLFKTEVEYDVTEKMIFENGYEIYTGNVEKHMVGKDIRTLDIEAGGCEFILEESEDENFYIKATTIGKFQCYVKDDELYVKSSQILDNSGKIVLYVPAAYQFKKVDVELGAGVLQMDVLETNEADFEVGAGQITMNFLRADNCKFDVGMGEILVEDMQVNDVKAEVGMGHLMMSGTVFGDLKGECAMGSMEVYLSGQEEDFDYTFAAAMGNVTVDGRDYSGLAQEKKVNNGADKEIKMECLMGNVLVEFEE